jgi:hypothetical protein
MNRSRSLIVTGKGQPNSKEDDYRVSITVDATAQEAFEACSRN